LFTGLGGGLYATTLPLVSSDLDHVESIFRSYDVDGNGYLDMNELMKLMSQLGHSGNSDRTQRLVNKITTTVDKRLSFLEFYHAYSGTQLL